MSVIYETKGRAREYCELALNLYKGCSHGCTYCYVPIFTRQNREAFHKNVTARESVIEKLEKEAPKYSGREVHLSFSTDTYQPIDDKLHCTRRAIEILNRNGASVTILTQAGLGSTRDFDLLSLNKENKYGATLTFINAFEAGKYEPRAPGVGSRMLALSYAKKRGIRTWASLEPAIAPSNILKIIELTKDYVDEYRVGKWSHAKEADLIDWARFAKLAVELLERCNKKYYIKKDLAKYLKHQDITNTI